MDIYLVCSIAFCMYFFYLFQLGGENDDTGKTPIQSYCYVLSNTAGRVSQAERCDGEIWIVSLIREWLMG